MKYKVYSLDVWGNEIDGFNVNDRCQIGTIELLENAPDDDILKVLKDGGYLKETVTRNDILIDGDDFTIFITESANSMPIFQLELLDF